MQRGCAARELARYKVFLLKHLSFWVESMKKDGKVPYAVFSSLATL